MAGEPCRVGWVCRTSRALAGLGGDLRFESSAESVWATASGEPSKSSGRQKRSREAKTRLRISGATLVVLMGAIVPVVSAKRYANLTT